MAKASLWQRIKGWFSGNKSAKSSGSSGSSQRTSNYYSSRKDGGTGYYRRAMLDSLRGKGEEEKPKYRSMAEATKKEPPKEKSSFAKLDSALKKDVPDPKRAAALKSQERAKANLNKTKTAVKDWNEANKQQSKEFSERTNHKYDVSYWKDKGDKAKVKEARLRVKMGESVAEPVAEELAVKYHPTAYSAARGAASGATFGASELAIKAQAKRDKERAKNEQYYQENKNKTAETVGELAGALASFGATAGATEKLGAKVVSKAAPRAAERLAEKKVVQGLAKRGVNKAVKKGLVSEATEELIKQTGKEKAAKIVSALGNDIVQNLTTGAIYDINKASAQHEVGSKDWWKELGTSAALNFAVTGGVAGGAILGGNKKAAVEAASELAKKSAPARRAQGQILGRAMANENALDRSFVLPEENIRIKDLVENTQAAEQAKRASALESLRANAEANAPRSERIGLRKLTNIDMQNEIEAQFRLGDIETRLDDAYRTAGDPTISPEVRQEAADDFTALLEQRKFAEDDLANIRTSNYEAARRGEPVTRQPEVRTKQAEPRVVKKPSEVMQGYSSKGSKQKLADVQKRAKNLVASGDTDGARREIEKAVDEIVRDTRIVEPIDETTREIKSLLKDTRVSVSNKADAGYLSGGYNEFRKQNFGTLKLTEDGTPVDDLWLSLQERYGTGLFPDEIANPSDQLQYLADITKAKDRQLALADDELLNLRSELTDSLWKAVNESPAASRKGVKQAAETLEPKVAIKSEPAPQGRSTREAADNLRATTDDWAGDYAGVEDDIPVENINQTRVNDANAEAQARAKRVMEEPPKADESSAKGAAKQTSEAAEEAGEREFTQGQKEAREAFYKKTGTKLDEGKAATDDQVLDALGNYERSQGTSAERKLSKVAFSQVAVSTDEAAEKLLKMQDEGAFGYDVVHHADMYKEVANDLENDWDRWIDKICDVAEGGDWSGKESTKLLYMSQYLAEVTDAAKSPEQDALSTMAYKAIQKLSTTSAQTMNGRRAYAHLSKAGKMECALDDMVAILDPAIGFNKQHRKAMMGLNKYERQHYIKGQLLKDEKLKGCLKKLANAKTEDDISEAYTEMFYQFNKSNPKSGFDIVQEIRYLNMLGNPKTHIRNMFGSGFFAPIRQVSNMIRGSIEDRIAKEAGLEITKHGGLSFSAAKEAWAKEPKTEAGKAALEAFENVKKDLLGSMKYDTPQYAGRGKTLAGKALDKVSDFNSNLLAKEDDFFKSRAFKENYIKSYNKYLKDGVPITDKIKKQIEEEALQEAQIATFNEYNEFAKWLSNITRKANDANASTLARWGGRAVNAVMPFTKVPANLMKQSINYSPIGIAKGMLNIKQAAKKGDAVLLNRAIDEFASGLTGTVIFGLGMLLGKTTDMFTTNTGKNDPAAKFKKDRGMQNYSITFKDPETGQGHSYTLDWLVPTSATFFSGVEMANQLKRGDFDILDIGNDWSTVMTRLAEPVMETSMLSGLHGMLETMRSGSDSDDAKSAIQVLLRETAQSYMSSMIPTVLGQASRTAYKSDMQITGEDDWEYFWNQTKSKAGLANTNILGEALGADTDAYGNIKGEKNSASDYVKAGLKNFLSPANIQKVDFSEVDNEKLRVYEEAVANGADPNDMAYLFPKKQYKKQFSVAGEDVKMSNKDLSAYNQAKTKGGEEGMRYLLENIMFNRYDYDSKGKKVPTAEAYTKAEKQALMEQFKGKSMREVEEWLYQQPEFKNASKAEQKKAISGLWGLSKDTKTVASQRVGEQAVYKAQGKDVNEYNYKNEITESKRDQLQPYIDSGLLTYEEAVDFARNGGKVSYTEDEDGGGSATTYYTKAAMIDYFVEHGIPYDKAEALYNAFKAKNAKPYSGNNKSSGRRGYGGYRRRGGGSRKAKVPTIKAKSMAAATKSAKGTTVKLEPPTPKTTKVSTKFKKYEV